MKDYYYILGIKKEASIDEIKQSYRKLSLKFHPDKNDGDDFFTEHFKEIQEAYKTLIDINKRMVYDNNCSKTNANNKYNFEPKIDYFRSDKSSFEFEEEVTFSWRTINSDKVTIKPFGIVQPIGQKTYKIKDFKNAFISFELIAENTSIGRQTKQSLELTNKTYQDLYNYFQELIKNENKHKNVSHSFSYNNSNNSKKINYIKYKTNRGILELEPSNNIIGTKVFMNGKIAPDGKYKLSWWEYFIIKDGIIIKG